MRSYLHLGIATMMLTAQQYKRAGLADRRARDQSLKYQRLRVMRYHFIGTAPFITKYIVTKGMGWVETGTHYPVAAGTGSLK